MADSQIQVTVIVPTYKRPEYLEKALRSVLSQSFLNFQVRVYDNASGDSTAAKIAQLAQNDPRVHYHCHAQNIGARENFLYGLREVDTPYFCFLSDDDLVLPDFLTQAMAQCAKHPDALFSALQTLNINESGCIWGVTGSAWPSGYYAGEAGIRAFCDFGHMIWTGIVFARECRPDFENLMVDYEVVSDLAIQLSLVLRGPFVVTSLPGAAFRTHDSSFSQASFYAVAEQTSAMVQRIVEQSSLNAREKSEVEARVKERFYPMVFGIWAQLVIKNQDPREILNFLDWLKIWQKKTMGRWNLKLMALGYIINVAAISAPVYQVFRRFCIYRYGRMNPSSECKTNIQKFQKLVASF